MRNLFLSFVLCLTLTSALSCPGPPLCPVSGFSAQLPQKIGPINDYGNVLSIPDRKELEKKIADLRKEGLVFTSVVSRVNPFRDVTRYSAEIRRHWEIDGDSNDLFLALVEGKEGWNYDLLLSSRTRSLLSKRGLLEAYRSGIKNRVSDRNIRQALLYSVRELHRAATQEPNSEKAEDTEPFWSGIGWFLPTVIGAPIIGSILLFYLLKREIMMRCPRCGGRLQVEERRGYGSSGEAMRREKCNNCGYSNTRSISG